MRAIRLVLALVACKGGAKSAANGSNAVDKLATGSGSGAISEVHFGPPNPGGDRELAFTITKVYAAQQATAAPPFHGPGGALTYFYAQLAADPAATFTVGMPKLESRGDFGGFGKLWLVPTTAEAGNHFVAAFAKAFHVDAPAAHAGKLGPLQVPMAVLGVGNARSDSGYGGSGTWDSTKLFLSADDIDSAELYFNVSIAACLRSRCAMVSRRRARPIVIRRSRLIR
jgi:hypothetical protein